MNAFHAEQPDQRAAHSGQIKQNLYQIKKCVVLNCVSCHKIFLKKLLLCKVDVFYKQNLVRIPDQHTARKTEHVAM